MASMFKFKNRSELALAGEAEETIDIDQSPDLMLDIPATVVKGDDGKPRLVPTNINQWRAALGRMVDRAVLVTLTRPKERRTTEANQYLWKGIYERLVLEFRAIAQDANERPAFDSKERVHEWCKYRFLGVETITVGGHEIERPATTTKLSPAEFSRYTNAIKELVAERWQIYID